MLPLRRHAMPIRQGRLHTLTSLGQAYRRNGTNETSLGRCPEDTALPSLGAVFGASHQRHHSMRKERWQFQKFATSITKSYHGRLDFELKGETSEGGCVREG